jgi:phosphomannomutase
MYCDKVESVFDLELIRKANIGLAYDAMYGAGQNVLKKLMPEITFLHCDYNPSFMGQAPEPIDKNLQEFATLIKNNPSLKCGLATDGDADRIGLYNSKGEFVDSHHIILLTIHYLVKYKGLRGKVVTGFSSTPRIKKLCAHYKLEHVEVPIGFKYIAGLMSDPEQDVLLGGEESGGIALKTHIPERDGIWMGFTIWEFMAKTGKSLEQLLMRFMRLLVLLLLSAMTCTLKNLKNNKSLLNVKKDLSLCLENIKCNQPKPWMDSNIFLMKTVG